MAKTGHYNHRSISLEARKNNHTPTNGISATIASRVTRNVSFLVLESCVNWKDCIIPSYHTSIKCYDLRSEIEHEGRLVLGAEDCLDHESTCAYNRVQAH